MAPATVRTGGRKGAGMFQVGHVQCRGTGSYVVTGPLGVALVTADLLEPAHQVVTGHLEPARFATSLASGRHRAFLLDLAAPLPLMTVQGGLTVRAWRYGHDEPDTWTEDFLGAQLDPAEYVALEVVAQDALTGPWLPLWHGTAAAGVVRIGYPGVTGAPAASPAPATETALPDVAVTAAVQVPDAAAPASLPPSDVDPELTYRQAPTLAYPPPHGAGEPGPSVSPSPASPSAASPFTFPTPLPVDPTEAYDATISQARLAQHRARPNPTSPVTLPRRVPVLVFAGTAPVAVTGDVVIGRDPDMRALGGRPPAMTLRVPSPDAEISRSHCVVMSDPHGPVTVMDLGSSNGTVIRRPDGARTELVAFGGVELAEGDSLELGEGVVVEVRGRDT